MTAHDPIREADGLGSVLPAATDELKAEVARVSKLISETHHAAVAAIAMGGTGKPYIARRDAMLEQLRQACLAPDDKRDQAINNLRGLT